MHTTTCIIWVISKRISFFLSPLITTAITTTYPVQLLQPWRCWSWRQPPWPSVCNLPWAECYIRAGPLRCTTARIVTYTIWHLLLCIKTQRHAQSWQGNPKTLHASALRSFPSVFLLQWSAKNKEINKPLPAHTHGQWCAVRFILRRQQTHTTCTLYMHMTINGAGDFFSSPADETGLRASSPLTMFKSRPTLRSEQEESERQRGKGWRMDERGWGGAVNSTDRWTRVSHCVLPMKRFLPP